MQIALSQVAKSTTDQQSKPAHLEETIRHYLDDSGYQQLRHVACHCSAWTAVLTGQVPSFYMKQIAQTIVGKVNGIERVDNRLEVVAE